MEPLEVRMLLTAEWSELDPDLRRSGSGTPTAISQPSGSAATTAGASFISWDSGLWGAEGESGAEGEGGITTVSGTIQGEVS
jgi:hypothetical protein